MKLWLIGPCSFLINHTFYKRMTRYSNPDPVDGYNFNDAEMQFSNSVKVWGTPRNPRPLHTGSTTDVLQPKGESSVAQ
jgi:hypothetical protein